MSNVQIQILEYRRQENGDYFTKIRTALGEFSATGASPDKAMQAALGGHTAIASALALAEQEQDLLDHPIVTNV